MLSTDILIPVRRFVAPEAGGVLAIQDLPNHVHALAAAHHLRGLSPIPPCGVEMCSGGRVRLFAWARPDQIGAVQEAIGTVTIWRATLDIEGHWLALTPGAPVPTIGRGP